MFLNDLEIILLFAAVLFFAGFFSWLLMHSGRLSKKAAKPAEKQKVQTKAQPGPEQPKISVFESYDYMGTKIYHNDGKYTVVEDNVSRNFRSLEDLPSKYRKMILEMQSQNFSGSKNRYFMENKNGQYFIVFPDGSRKSYKSYKDIPEKLKKILSS